jgi:hypothetical protein
MIGSITQVQQQMAAIEKRRKKDRHPGPALTAAHEADRACLEAECDGQGHCDGKPMAGKAAIPGLEAQPGPGSFTEPGQVSPEDFQRGPLQEGHAATSPLHGPPNTSPVPPQVRDMLTPLGARVTGGGPIAGGIRDHQARAAMPPRPVAAGGL